MPRVFRLQRTGALLLVWLAYLAVVVVVFAVAVLAFSAATPAAVRTPFEPARFSANDTGDVAIVGNTLATCPAAVPNCLAARDGAAGGRALNNNAYNMQFVDVDNDSSTFNSSRADFELPDGGEVLWAGLYWGARSSDAATNQVVFDTPGPGGYQTLTGEIVGSFGGPPAYHAFEEVTGLVQQTGSGTYAVGNVQAALGTDRYAGWSLVVAYRDPSAPPRNLTVFDGFADVADSAGNRVVDVPISGFTAPPNGSVNARLGVVAYEGDAGSTGDSLRFRGGSQQSFTTISDAGNPPNNFFNSAITRLGQRVSDKNPDYTNQLGFDAVVVDASGIVPNGATNATLRLATGGETYYPGVVTTSIELYAPAIDVRKTVTDLNGGEAVPGDVLEYEVTATNTGQDFADDATLVDEIPANTTYVPGSLEVISGANGGQKTDAAGDDQGEFDPADDSVVFRVGAGADGTNGGTLVFGGPPGDSTTIRFRVEVDTSAEGTRIINQATANYVGRTLQGDPLVSNSNLAQVPVPPYADLSITKTGGPNPVTVGERITYDLTVANAGVSEATGVTVTDDLPNGTTFVSATPSTCSEAGGVVTCDLGDLAAGDEADVEIVVEATELGTVLNTASVASDLQDPNPDDNEATARTTVEDTSPPAPRSDLSITKRGPPTATVGRVFSYSLGVANAGPDTASGVRLTDRLPVGLRFASASKSCSNQARVVTCELGSIASGASKNVTIRVLPVTSGAKTNTATVDADQPDPDSADNRDGATTRVGAVPCADLALRVGAPDRVVVGKSFPYTVAISNRGPATVRNAVLTSRLPKTVKFVKASDGCRYDRATRKVTCGLGDMPDGAKKQRKIVVKAQKAGTVRLRSCAVKSGTPDCDTSNNRLGAPGVRPRVQNGEQTATGTVSGVVPETTVVPATDGSS